MDPSGRCRRGAVILCINSIISVPVFKFMGNVGRKRHFSKFVQDLLKDPLIGKTDKPVSVGKNFLDLSFKKALAEDGGCACPKLFSGADQGFPKILAPPL